MYDSEKSQYQIEAVGDVDKDIISIAGQRLGRLYVFAVEEDSLLRQGIKQQWFMTCQQEIGGTVVAGHINEAGQWSLCSLGNLQPSQEWKAQQDILAAIFSSDRQVALFGETYKHGSRKVLSALGKELSLSTEGIDSEETKYDIRTIEKAITTPIDQTMSVNTIVSENKTDEQELARSSLPMVTVRQHPQSGIATQEEIIQPESVTQTKITEEQRLKLEQQLVAVIVAGHQQNLLNFDDEDSQNFWQLNLDPDRNVLILRSCDDGHVVIAVSFDGEVVSSLSVSDAELLGDGLLTREDLEKIKKIEIKEKSLKTETPSGVLQPTKLQEAKKSQEIELD
jgi:hypothetical protein